MKERKIKKMTERDLVIEYIPQITELAIVVKGMTAEQYTEFKQDHLDYISQTCPKTHEFISNIFKLIEWVLSN